MTGMLYIVIGLTVVVFTFAFFGMRQNEDPARLERLLPPRGQTPTDEDVKRLAEAGEKIAAIKCYRQIHNAGLKEAKDAVEAMTMCQ